MPPFDSEFRSSDEADAPDPIRARRLADIRARIEDGTYETTERLDAALSRLLAAVGDEL